MIKSFLLLIFTSIVVFAEGNVSVEDVNLTVSSQQSSYELTSLRQELEDIKKVKELNSEWIKTYSGFIARKELLDRKEELENSIKKLKSLKSLTQIQQKRLKNYETEKKILEDKINLVKNFEKDPFKKLIAPPSLNDAPKVDNPFSIITALSYLKDLSSKKSKYLDKYNSLEKSIETLAQEKKILEQIAKKSNYSLDKEHLEYVNKELQHLYTIKDIFKTTKDLYLKKSEELKISIENDIKKELKKVVNIAIVAFVFLVLFLISKYLTRKYMAEKESFYTINKVINISFITILLFIFLFAYLENVSYLITILGFASAGIAIAMKDWFMSLMGWFVITLGGAIHVGNRVKIVKDGAEYVGDVVDISLLRITIYEDVTLTTYTQNRRAGRIIFVPNNYIFTDMIANYSHAGLKTVWDGIDFYVTFDSNINKATTIAKNIAKQYSKGYTDMTRKQLGALRSKYQLKNTNVEPKVFAFIEGYGMKISVWYLTNSYATLTLRGTISTKIIEELRKESDIEIAYPTQSLYLDKNIPKPVEINE